MQHYIIVKFNDQVTDIPALVPEISAVFAPITEIPGIHEVQVHTCCIDRPNRHDLMIRIDMEPEALTVYDHCPSHMEWKEKYGHLIAHKTIFDCQQRTM